MSTEASVEVPSLARPLAVVGATLAVLIVGTAALWMHYGTAVFYEMVLAGLAACL